MTQPTTSDLGQAIAAALLRHGAVLILWIAWFVTRTPWTLRPDPFHSLSLPLLSSSCIRWVNKPTELSVGPQYARRPHWSVVFVIPSILAIAMLVRDVILTARAAFS